MNCPNCGQEVSEISRGQFCPYCGASLTPRSGEAPSNATPTFEQPSSSTGGERQFSCAWENRDKLGFIAALSQTWTESVLRPTEFFRKMPRTGGIGAPLLYAVLIQTIASLFWLFWEYLFFDSLGSFREWPEGMPFQMNRGLLITLMPFIPFLVIIGVFIESFIYHVCLLITGSAKYGWEATFRVLAYACGPSIFLFVPFCGGVVGGVWSLVLEIIGWREAHESTTGRVVIAALLPLLLCCCVIFWAIFMFGSVFKNLPIPGVMVGQVLRAIWP